MAKLEGGIFSNPSGKTAGIVFGAARTRQGKKVTARQLVPPSNPNTTAQQAQRGKFTDCLAIVRHLGAECYQSDFNRAISQLPGFQSLMSVFMNAMDDSKELSVPPSINLGTLHFPDTLSIATSGGDDIIVTISDENGGNGTADDKLALIAVDVSSTGRATLIGDFRADSGCREDGEGTLLNLTAGNTYLIGAYMRGVGDADGMLSVCNWYEHELV